MTKPKIKKLLSRFKEAPMGTVKPFVAKKCVVIDHRHIAIKTTHGFILWSEYDRGSTNLDGHMAELYNTNVFVALEALVRFGEISRKDCEDFIADIRRIDERIELINRMEKVGRDAAALGFRLVAKEQYSETN